MSGKRHIEIVTVESKFTQETDKNNNIDKEN